MDEKQIDVLDETYSPSGEHEQDINDEHNKIDVFGHEEHHEVWHSEPLQL